MAIDYGKSNDLYLAERLRYREDRPQSAAAYSSVDATFLRQVIFQALGRGFLLAVLVSPTLIIGIGFILVPLAFFVPWFMKDQVYGGHWYFSMEDEAHLHESAFSLIAQRLQDKRIPATITPRLISSGISEAPRYYLKAQQNRHLGYISVLPYGSDLFVSWTMWREEIPVSVLWNWLKETLARVVGKGTAFHEIVRHDPARALRETIHNATRAGVDAASNGDTATITGTFGQELQLEPASSAPMDVAPMPATANWGATPQPANQDAGAAAPPMPPPSAQPPPPPTTGN